MTKTNILRWATTLLLATLLAQTVGAQPQDSEEPAAPQEPGVSEPRRQLPPEAPHYAAGYDAIGDDYYKGKSTKEELDARVATMETNRNDRRTENQRGLLNRWGGHLLNHPGCRDELRTHARREAHVAWALFLARTNPSVKNQANLVNRLEALQEKEEERHTKAMERLRSTVLDAGSVAPAAPSASASAGVK